MDDTEDGIPNLCRLLLLVVELALRQPEQEPENWQTATRPELDRAGLSFNWCGKEIGAQILTTLLGLCTYTAIESSWISYHRATLN
jgi:hypothetical protein